MTRPTRERRRQVAATSAPTRAEADVPATRPPGAAAFELDEETDHVVAILGSSSRKGSWEPAARLRVLALLGGVELDFREADLLEGDTEVEVLALMGGVNIVVPPDVDVQASGLGFLGGFTSASNQAPEPGAPRIRVTGWAVMGGVEVKVKKLPLRKRLIPDS